MLTIFATIFIIVTIVIMVIKGKIKRGTYE